MSLNFKSLLYCSYIKDLKHSEQMQEHVIATLWNVTEKKDIKNTMTLLCSSCSNSSSKLKQN